MDTQNLINAAAGVALSVLGWFARQLWDAIQKLKDDLSTLREEIAKDYITKDDFKDVVSEIKTLLEKIDSKLDLKADK